MNSKGKLSGIGGKVPGGVVGVGDEDHIAVPPARVWIGFVTHDFIHDDLRLRDCVDRRGRTSRSGRLSLPPCAVVIKQSIPVVGSGFAHPRIHVGQVSRQECFS